MILPTTYAVALTLVIASMLLWAISAMTQKGVGKWRFELLYLDFSVGVLIFSLASAFTLGFLNSKEISFMDNFLLTGNRQIAYGVAAGVLLSVGTALTGACASVVGISIGLPFAFGFTVLVTALGAILSPSFFVFGFGVPDAQNRALLYAGAGVSLAAIGASSFAWLSFFRSRRKAEPARTQHGRSKKAAQPMGFAPLVLGLLGGVVLAVAFALLNQVRSGDNGVSAYGTILLAGSGMFAASIVVGPFMMFIPVQGASLTAKDYLTGTIRQHLVGALGGMCYAAAFLAFYLAMSVPAAQRVGPALTFGAAEIGVIIAALAGLLVYKEYAGIAGKSYGAIALIALAVGLIAAGSS